MVEEILDRATDPVAPARTQLLAAVKLRALSGEELTESQIGELYRSATSKQQVWVPADPECRHTL